MTPLDYLLFLLILASFVGLVLILCGVLPPPHTPEEIGDQVVQIARRWKTKRPGQGK